VTAVIVGSATFGGWVQSFRDDEKLSDKNQEITRLTDQNRTLSDKIEVADRDFKAITNTLNTSARTQRAIQSKSEFLERFLAYKLAPGDTSTNTFIHYVCALWVNSESHDVHVNETANPITAEEVRAGLSPELKKRLMAQGIPQGYFDVVEHEPATGDSRPNVSRISPADAMANILKTGQDGHLVKTVDFKDGTHYTVPEEISTAVHNDPTCRPH
jgi:hypothetical protein